MNASASFFQITMKQLTAGQPFGVEYRLTHIGPVMAGDITLHADLRIDQGELGTAYNVNIPLAGRFRSRHRGVDIDADADTAPVYGPSGETAITWWAAHSRILAVKIDRTAVERTLADTLRHPARLPHDVALSIDLHSGRGLSWASLLRHLLAQLENPENVLGRPMTAAPYVELLVNGFLMVTSPAYQEALDQPIESTRPAAIRTAVDIIHAEAHTPLTTADLARRCHVSVRTLQEGFRRHLDLPPIAYLRSVRLDRAHAELRAANPFSDTVTGIAYRWGFTNLTRFANRYRARYGESPSETLQGR